MYGDIMALSVDEALELTKEDEKIFEGLERRIDDSLKGFSGGFVEIKLERGVSYPVVKRVYNEYTEVGWDVEVYGYDIIDEEFYYSDRKYIVFSKS